MVDCACGAVEHAASSMPHTPFLPSVQVAAGYVLHVGEFGRGAMRMGNEVTVALEYEILNCNPPQVAAGYVLHMGVGRGAMRMGDEVTAAVNLKP